jgi:V8-like Glu-specific endopeptidase
MARRSQTAGSRVALALAALLVLGLSLAGDAPGAALAATSGRLHPTAPPQSAAGEAARVAAHWTPARMRAAAPLDGAAQAGPLATTSFLPVEDATLPPYAVEGRIFLRQGRNEGYCSGTAIDTPSRRLVLTAGHCVRSGPGEEGGAVWSRYLEFVPAYTDGATPFGTFVARRNAVFAPRQWVRHGNPNYDVGAILFGPNEDGLLLDEAVGGVAIALDRSRHTHFRTFGYPGRFSRLQTCSSPAVGEDRETRRVPGPPTVEIHCRWVPGASGGGWLTEDGTEINGLTSYGRLQDSVHTFGPYFSKRNVGALVRGL